MRYIVTKAFRPKGSGSPEAKVGSELELSESQARVFKAVGFVKDAAAKAAAPTPAAEESAAPSWLGSYRRRDMNAEEPAERRVAAKKTTRTYTRRTTE